jgi:hypothetical protein
MHKKYFPFTAGSVCCVERFTDGGESFDDDEEVETEMRKWLRQQSKDFYIACFDTLVKRWDKYIDICGGYFEK